MQRQGPVQAAADRFACEPDRWDEGEEMSEEEFILDHDVIWPRTVKERYGVYRVKDGGRPELVATCRTPGEVGATLCRLGAEGEFLNYCVGVLDGRDHKNEKDEWVGKWLVLPWVAKEKGDDVQEET